MSHTSRPGPVTRPTNATQHPGYILLNLKRRKRMSTKQKNTNERPIYVPETTTNPTSHDERNVNVFTIEQFAQLCLRGLQLPQETETSAGGLSPTDSELSDEILDPGLCPIEINKRLL